MHPVLGKMKLKSFETMFDVHGTDREVVYVEAEEGAPSALVIKGLSVEDALHVLSRLHGGLLKGEDAAPVPTEKESKKAAPKAEKKAEAPKPEPKPEPAPPPKIEVVDQTNGASDDEEDLTDTEDGSEGDGPQNSDDAIVDMLLKQDKLRGVVQVMIDNGHKTPEQIVAFSRKVKDKVPQLAEVEAKGNFDKRMERAALVVLGGE